MLSKSDDEKQQEKKSDQMEIKAMTTWLSSVYDEKIEMIAMATSTKSEGGKSREQSGKSDGGRQNAEKSSDNEVRDEL